MAKKNVAAPAKKASGIKKLLYKGYAVVQSSRNNHVMIGKDGKVVHHEACGRPITEREMKKMVDDYIALAERLGKKCSK